MSKSNLLSWLQEKHEKSKRDVWKSAKRAVNVDKLRKVRVTLPMACINAFFGCIAKTVKMYLMLCHVEIYMHFLRLLAKSFMQLNYYDILSVENILLQIS